MCSSSCKRHQTLKPRQNPWFSSMICIKFESFSLWGGYENWKITSSWKVSVGLQQVTRVFASFFGIISIHRNKRECCTTTQSLFKIRNVSCWWFFSFDTHFKGKSGPDHFETLKKWISVVMTLGSECREKIFYWSSASNMYVCKLLWNHIYPQKQTGVLYDAQIRF